MAVTIVGQTPEIPQRTRCNHCRIDLEYLPSDIKWTKDPREPRETYIICPMHGMPVFVQTPYSV